MAIQTLGGQRLLAECQPNEFGNQSLANMGGRETYSMAFNKATDTIGNDQDSSQTKTAGARNKGLCVSMGT